MLATWSVARHTSACGSLTSRSGLARYFNATSTLPPLDGSEERWEQEEGLEGLGAVTSSAMKAAGWRWGLPFARFDPHSALRAVLEAPHRHSGALLLIVPGNTSRAPGPQRRADGQAFITIDKKSAPHLESWVPVATLNAAAGAFEAATGRRVFPFRIKTATLVSCARGSGPCAVWEASSGKLILDVGMAAQAAAKGSPLSTVMSAFAEALRPYLDSAARMLSSGLPAQSGTLADDAAQPSNSRGAGSEAGSGLARADADRAASSEAAASSGMGSSTGPESVRPESVTDPLLRRLAAEMARGGAAAVMLAMASPMPVWFCIGCAVVLGLFAPFIFNFGLTAAAEAMCSNMHLPDDACADLWWGAFALALMLSLGSAIPIVYICKLPDCIKRHIGG